MRNILPLVHSNGKTAATGRSMLCVMCDLVFVAEQIREHQPSRPARRSRGPTNAIGHRGYYLPSLMLITEVRIGTVGARKLHHGHREA